MKKIDILNKRLKNNDCYILKTINDYYIFDSYNGCTESYVKYYLCHNLTKKQLRNIDAIYVKIETNEPLHIYFVFRDNKRFINSKNICQIEDGQLWFHIK